MAYPIFNSEVKVNVIPTMIQATINFQIHPAQTHRSLSRTLWLMTVQLHVLNPFDDQALGYQLPHQITPLILLVVNIVPQVLVFKT